MAPQFALAQTLKQVIEERSHNALPQTVFLFTGEGVHCKDTAISVLKTSSSWTQVIQAIQGLGYPDAELFLVSNLGKHEAPSSPVVTVAIGILNADLWRQWGQTPDVVLGHSVGEIAAAYASGMLTVWEAIKLAHDVGRVVAGTPGSMVHTTLPRRSLSQFPSPDGLHLAAINYVVKSWESEDADILSVTLCGSVAAVEAYLLKDPAAVQLKPQHPWHHPSFSGCISSPSPMAKCTFLSSVTGTELTSIGADHWSKWLQQPVLFGSAIKVAATKPSVVIEMGAHPIMADAVRAAFGDQLQGYVCSMKRKERGTFVRSQRAALPGFRDGLKNVLTLQGPRGVLDFQQTFAEQGITSQQLVPLADALASYFPGLAVHDLYQYTSLSALVTSWDELTASTVQVCSSTAAALEVLGCSVRLPAGVDSPGAFWSLIEKDDKESAFYRLPEDAPKAAYVSFDAKQARAAAEAAGCEGAEAAALDPQHALALQLAQELWRDAGQEATQAALSKPDRVGVYIGAWQSVASSGKASAYRTIGSSLSALAPRVANAFNLQGPVMTVNTACSSALVAVDHALRDAKAGKIDFAIVGGVNLFGDDQQLFADLRRAGMLSPTGRCHTFSASGDGYVRAEGGVLFLLHAGSSLPSRARILGSAVTQNSKQKPLSAVDPAAQERVIRSACADAGVKPSQLSAVELHGTGTPLGDPVEVSALSKAIGQKDGTCVMTAAKMHVGHLESAAGSVGLLKAVLMCEQRRVPGFCVDGGVNPHVKAAMAESCLEIPSEDVQLDADAFLGVSSFGFAGSNAHVVVTSPETRLPKYDRKEYEACEFATAIVRPGDSPSVRSGDSTESPRDGETVVSTKALESHADTDGLSSKPDTSLNNLEIVSKAVCSILGDEAVASDANFMELGVDSLGLAELLGLLEDSFGAGCITIDQIMELPSVRAIAEHVEGLDAMPSMQSANPVPKQSAADSQKIAATTQDLDDTSWTAPTRSPFGKLESCSNLWIRATHVGSLPRPTDGNFDLGRVCEQQLEAGVDVINDGEWTRDNYIADVVSRIEGLRGGDSADKGYKNYCCVKHTMPLADDMKDVPIYALRFTGGNGLITLNPKRVAVSDLACIGHPRYAGGKIESLEPLLDAFARVGKPLSDGFYSVPSPGTLALFCKDEFFYDHHAYVEALGDALAHEFEQIAATGLQLQVDCPDLAMGRHTRWADLDDDAFLKVAEYNVAALNRALRDVAVEQIRVHVCWGNYAGPHHKDIPADLMWPLLGQVRAKYLLVEGANARHRNDIAAFEKAVMKGYFKADQVIVPGMIDTTTARLEDPKMIAENLLRYARAAGHPSRVMAGTDCGFATTANSTAITADIAWMKLRSLAEGARLATTRFIEQSAPVLCKSPLFRPTPFRAAVIVTDSDREYGEELAAALQDLRVHSVEILSHKQDLFAALCWAVDTPLAIVGIGECGIAAERTLQQLQEDKAVARRPATLITIDAQGAATEAASAIQEAMLAKTHFDKRCLVLPRCGAPPAAVDVVIVGAGLLGLVTAHRCLEAGFTVAVLEQRPLVGGIWSMYANGTSQVNSSEGGYCFKEFIGDAGGKFGDNRDHSTAAEILRDMAKLGDSLKEHIFTCVKVMKVLGKAGEYTVAFQDSGGLVTTAAVTQCRGVVLCINDRVGLPRPLAAPMVGKFQGIVADGTADSLAGIDWKGKRVVIVGMGAFAVENVRTALEHGAAQVTVVARRHGTICPKVIDYLNFVKPWDENYKHDTQTNVKQFLRWKQLYAAAGCTTPSCWPKQVKEDGHTISVSDVWFIGHHMKKLSTRTGNIASIETDGVRITSQEFIPCDIVVGCIGFERSNYLVEYLTGRTSVTSANYLDKDMMYLADAEIDEGAFNSFFGSSVLEYGKFFSNVYVEGLKRGEVLGERLWGSDTVSVPISERKWNQYIAAAQKLIGTDPAIAAHARTQVDVRTEHFWRTMPPKSFVAVNKKEWEELHQRLNGGLPVPKEAQLKYFFEDAAEWC